jgi:uncharacterized OsmC-like protein
MENRITPAEASPAPRKTSRPAVPPNGVDTPTLFATLDAVRAQPELARFQFRATNRRQQGAHSRTTFENFYGVGAEQKHVQAFQFDSDHPATLAGRDNGPTAIEFLLHAIAACITAGLGTIAAEHGVTLYEVESKVEGDIDLRGMLGLSSSVRNGYQRIRVSFRVKGNAPPEELAELVEQSRARSAVYDVLTGGVPVDVRVNEA